MSIVSSPIVERMQSLADRWTEASDQRSIFLRCYVIMAQTMLLAIQGREFRDPEWVSRLLHCLANYYFQALQAYEANSDSTPGAWQRAHAAAQDPDIAPLHKLLLGVNAHINHDLLLALIDLLGPEWAMLSEVQRAERYADHCHVNDVIARTIDIMQDSVLEPLMPSMAIADRILGPLDEMFVFRLISSFRDGVWQRALVLVQVGEAKGRGQLLQEVDHYAVRRAQLVLLTGWRS